MDDPDGHRKAHSPPVPRTGGLAILVACIAAFAVVVLSPIRHATPIDVTLVLGVLFAVLIVFATGLWDDLLGLTPAWKLTGQLVAATVAYAAGIRVLGLAGVSTEGWWSFPLTILWLVGCANAFNLIDGVDGLAAGLGLVASGTTLLAALLENNVALALATAPLLGALLAFLRFNFSPASVFLGDCGSLAIGFVLGCYGAIWSQKSTTLMGMTAPLMALAVPLLDTCLSIVRRYLRHQPIFVGDRNHIHHRLLERGLTPRDVAFALSLMGALAAGFALVQTATHSRFGGIVVVAFGSAVWLGVRSLGYIEFQTARYLASTGVFRHILNVQVYLRSVEEKMAVAAAPKDYWAIVRDAGRTFAFSSVDMRLDGAQFHDGPHGINGEECCRVRIPLLEGDYVEFAHARDLSVQRAVALSSLADILKKALGRRPRHVQALAGSDALGSLRKSRVQRFASSA